MQKKILYFIISLSFLFSIFSSVVVFAEVDCSSESPNEVVVQFVEGGHSTINNEFKLVSKNNYFYTYEIPKYMSVDDALNILKSHPNIVFAEEVYNRCITGISQEPLYYKQWYLKTIDYLNSIDLVTSDKEIVVAVLDTGVSAKHLELKGKLLPGYDVVNDDDTPEDDHGHGTFVAGVIAANINGQGIGGLAPNVKILPVKVGDQAGQIQSNHIAEGIYYAIEQGADIINMSFAGYKRSSIEYRAIQEAKKNDIVLIAAAGNRGKEEIAYPAKYPEVIAVGAMDKVTYQTKNPLLLKAKLSNYGPELNVMAPGVDIVSLETKSGYAIGEGTSYAAPIVSSLAALIKSENEEWNANMIQWAIERGATLSPYSSGEWSKEMGYGVVHFTESLKLKSMNLVNDTPDEKQKAEVLRLNEVLEEKMDLPSDVDWFKFKLHNAGEIDFFFDYQFDDLTIEVEIYKGNELVKRVTSVGEVLSLNLDKGEYFVKVSEIYNRWSAQSYVIQVSGNIREPLVLNDVSYVYVTSKELRGKGTPGADVLIEAGGRQVARGTVADDGTFTVSGFKGFKIGDRLSVKLVNRNGDESERVIREVLPFYPDVNSNKSEVLRLSEEGIIRGFRDGKYRPFDNVTRTQAVQIIMSTSGVKPVQHQYKESILGIRPGEYGYDHLVTAKKLGWLQGLGSDGRGKLTRGEMALLLSRAFDYSGMGELEFSDIENGTELYEAVHVLAANNVVMGYLDGTYRPDEPIRRDHIAVLLARILAEK
ncbi:S8 family serine peptidase [Bacillaceae bacterium W0354]